MNGHQALTGAICYGVTLHVAPIMYSGIVLWRIRSKLYYIALTKCNTIVKHYYIKMETFIRIVLTITKFLECLLNTAKKIF